MGLVLTYFLYLCAIASHQTFVHVSDPFEFPLVVALIFLLYSIFKITSLFCLVLYRNSLIILDIGIFMSLAAVAKILLGTVLLGAIGLYMPALLFFVNWVMAHFFQ